MLHLGAGRKGEAGRTTVCEIGGHTEMTDLETIRNAVRDVMQEEMKAFYIDREAHYQHHHGGRNDLQLGDKRGRV